MYWALVACLKRRALTSVCLLPQHVMSERYSRFMETPTFRGEHWRKSSQWFMLTRR